MARREVRVSLAGVEVAKWIANRGPMWRGGGLGEGVGVTNVAAPIVRELDGESTDVVYLAPEAQVTFAVWAIEATAAPDVALEALEAVDAATGGLPSRCDQLAVEVNLRG